MSAPGAAAAPAGLAHPGAGDDRGPRGRMLALGGALLIAAIALGIAAASGGRVPGALPEALRVAAAATALFGLCGYAPARLLTPTALRAHWQLLVLPTGAVVSGLALTVLGFAYVPYGAALVAVLVAGALGAIATHRLPAARRRCERLAAATELPPRAGGAWSRNLWPAYVAAALMAVTLLPFLRIGTPVVPGEGSDSHLAAGAGEFLKHAYPSSTDYDLPVDRMPLTWRSKYPIYYSFAAVSSLSGIETVEALAPTAAYLGALAALGFFLLATYLLRAPPLGGLLAMGLVGLNPMVLLTINNPYFNQTWGLLAMPFMIVLGCLAVVRPSKATIGLAALFWAVGAFAYPLMAAFPAIAAVVCFAVLFAQRRRAGDPIDLLAPVRRLPRSTWLIPVYALAGLMLAVPLYGVFEKVVSGAIVALSDRSLAAWAGDVTLYYPVHLFFSAPDPEALGTLVTFAVVACAALGVSRAPRAFGAGLAATMVLAAAFALLFHEREFGQYFYFKTLAFLGPIAVTCAAAGAAALVYSNRRALAVGGGLAMAALLGFAALAGRDRTLETHYQVGPELRELREWDRALPKDASIRLDVRFGTQFWASYFLASHPLSATYPVSNTQYPYVQFSRKADYILSKTFLPRPHDALKQPVFKNFDYTLWKMKPDVPGFDRSSRRMNQTVTSIGLS